MYGRQTLPWDYFLLARENEAAGAADAAAWVMSAVLDFQLR
jgi:hypothetical protein